MNCHSYASGIAGKRCHRSREGDFVMMLLIYLRFVLSLQNLISYHNYYTDMHKCLATDLFKFCLHNI